MLKFAVLNDLHLADNSPIGRQLGYADHLFNKLVGIATIMEEQKATLLVLTGDVFHLKRPDRVSHSLVNRLIDVLKNDFDCGVVICPGNHDLAEAGIDSLPRQPLQSLFTSEVARPLIADQAWMHEHHGKSSVLFIGRHYSTAGDYDPFYYVPTEAEVKLVRRLEANVVIMVAHGSVTPPGVHPIYDHITVDQIPWEEALLVPDVALFGHLHADYGIHKTKGGPIYANLGSFSRPSRNQFVDSRDFLMVTIGDDLKIKMERIPIPNMLPAAEVFIEKTEEQDNDALAEFAEQLASSIVLEETPIDEALAALGDVPILVKRRIQKYLEEAGL